ncbi:gp141R [Rabbit fibroma virus]|uniref:Hemagglutinin n=1 Tax=Rabbit fibroma virus (strain Kasza) TaxID=10272 RepID=Q9Q8U0_RFVKA|nr:Ig domain OX-2-like protein [Rabbit fibroma virus]AAF18021.1 gp141R [Rabbit fibroma virus]
MNILSILALLSTVAYAYAIYCTNTTTVYEHVNVTISCNNTGSRDNDSSNRLTFHLITWKKDNKTTVAGYGPSGPAIGNKNKIEYLSTGYNTSTILIKNVTVKDSGLYYCIFETIMPLSSEEGVVWVNVTTPSATTTSLQQPQPLALRTTSGRSTSTYVTRTSTGQIGDGFLMVETRRRECSSSSSSSSRLTSSLGSRNLSRLFKVILIIKMIFYIPNLIIIPC